MKYKDYYTALNVPRDADLEQIKKAYRTLKVKFAAFWLATTTLGSVLG